MYQPLSESLAQILRRKFPEDVVSTLVEAFEEFRRKDAVTSEEHQRSIQELKYEIKLVEASLTERIKGIEASLTERIKLVEASLTERIERVKAETALEMEKVKAELMERIEACKTSLLKWVIALWLTQTLTLGGIILALFQYFK